MDRPAKRRRVDEGSILLAQMLQCSAGDMAVCTPVHRARILSEQLGCDVHLKREDTQIGFSHHIRTAYTLVSALSDDALHGRIVVTGHGNFAHAVALALDRVVGESTAHATSLTLTAVLPETTPSLLLRQLRSFVFRCNAVLEVVLEGNTQSATRKHADILVKQHNAVLLQNTEGSEAVAAAGSLAVELFAQLPSVAGTVYIGVTSGALLAAISEYAAQIHPETTVVAVEAEGEHSLSKRLANEERSNRTVPNEYAVTIIAKHLKSGRVRFLSASHDEQCAAIKSVFLDTRSILEPAGALSVAGLKKDGVKENAGIAVAVLGSANLEFTTLRSIAERSEENEVLVTVELPEENGAFKRMYSHIYPQPVTEFSYRYGGGKKADVFMSFAVKSAQEGAAVVSALNGNGFPCTPLKENELAKAHARYLVGGRGGPADERLLRFQFPENGDALQQFLGALPAFAGVSLFHYRNHGADFGKVLVGMNVPAEHEIRFQTFLSTVEYEYTDETSNPFYRMFLR